MASTPSFPSILLYLTALYSALDGSHTNDCQGCIDGDDGIWYYTLQGFVFI